MEIELTYNESTYQQEYIFPSIMNMYIRKIKLEPLIDELHDNELYCMLRGGFYIAYEYIGRDVVHLRTAPSIITSIACKKIKCSNNRIKFNLYHYSNYSRYLEITYDKIFAYFSRHVKITIQLGYHPKKLPTDMYIFSDMTSLCPTNLSNLLIFVTKKTHLLQYIETDSYFTKTSRFHNRIESSDMILEDFEHLNVYVCDITKSSTTISLKKCIKTVGEYGYGDGTTNITLCHVINTINSEEIDNVMACVFPK